MFGVVKSEIDMLMERKSLKVVIYLALPYLKVVHHVFKFGNFRSMVISNKIGEVLEGEKVEGEGFIEEEGD